MKQLGETRINRARPVLSGVAALGTLVASLVATGPALAHAFGQRYDLPVPLSLYLVGAGAAVAVSFIIIGVFLGNTGWSRAYPRIDLLRFTLGRFSVHPITVNTLKAAGVFLFALVLATGFFGNQHPMQNFAPILVWVLWWVGMAYVQAFVGDIWTVINPWRTLFAWAENLYARATGDALSRCFPYPKALGVWPAVALLAAFAWAELVFPDPAIPANVAGMVVVYSAVTWAGMFLFGRERWLNHGEAFSLVFDILARFAPTETRVAAPAICETCGLDCRDGDGNCIDCATCFSHAGAGERELALRPFAAGLLRNERASVSVTAFVLLVVAMVLYDGLLATPGWTRFEDLMLAAIAATGEIPGLIIRALGLVGFWLVLLGAYLLTCRVMAAVSDGLMPGDTASRFVYTLVPIAIAYHFAHYLTYLLVQGQYAVPLASDPFGFGWNLFGTVGYEVEIAVVGASFAWHLAITAIVIGHIIAVYLAHVIAMTTFKRRKPALRSQYPMTALMVMFTVTSLSILAEPIVQRPANATEDGATRVVVPVPADALLPAPGSGLLRPVGAGKTARAGIHYGALTSIFHDGTKTTVADLLYAYAFAYRWGTEGGDGYDPEIGRSTALMRQRLVGVKVVGIDKASKSIRVGDFAFIRELVLVDVYLNGPAADQDGTASVAPPWSTVPWHVLALMEAAVQRGWAAFSEAEAARLGVPWLDLARSAPLKEKLASLVDEFAAKGFRPGTLEPLISGEEARKRWAALKAYYGDNGHFLVTNGPYRLAGWPDDATVLKVFRDITYPLGVGSYDAYAVPRNAHITAVEPVDAGFALAVDIERMEKFMRSYKIVREPLAGAGAPKRQTLECRYVVVAGDRQVRLAGQGRLGDDGRMVIDLAGKLPPGDYTVLATLYLNGNTVGQDVRRIPYRVR